VFAATAGEASLTPPVVFINLVPELISVNTTGTATVLVPFDVSEDEPLPEEVLGLLSSVGVVLLGYYPVPSQAAPAQIKHQHEEDAERRVDEIADRLRGRADTVTGLLVFTHDRDETVDRVADEHEADAVLTPGEVTSVEGVLVPVRGGQNIENLLGLTGALLGSTEATATLVHSVDEESPEGHGEELLKDAAERLVDLGVDGSRVRTRVSAGDDTAADIASMGDEFDVLVIGETEPSLRDRILGRVPSRILANTSEPVFVVRDTDSTETDA